MFHVIWDKGSVMAKTYELITSYTVSSATYSLSITSIPQTYTDLLVVFSLRSDYGTAHEGQLIFNSVSSGYTQTLLYGTGGGTGSATPGTSSTGTWTLNIVGGGATANTFSNGELYFPNYSNTSVSKCWSGTTVTENNGSTAYQYAVAGSNTSTAAISSLTFYAWQSFINFVSGSKFYLYGIKNS